MTRFPEQLEVRIFLPDETEPALVGNVLFENEKTSFVYDGGYLGRENAISIYDADLPLGPDEIWMGGPMTLAPSLWDALPDLWGRRSIAAAFRFRGEDPYRGQDIDEFTVATQAGPDRIGALDLRPPGHKMLIRKDERPSLENLMALADLIEANEEVEDGDLWDLIPHCTLVGGARPKALYTDAIGRKFIAKFTAEDDTYPVVAAEFVAMRLAALAGIDVAPVEIVNIGRREILLVERFDRVAHPDGGWARRAMVSALTWAQEAELSAHHISYPQLAGIIAGSFQDPPVALEELFTRVIFNILVGNTDDHARNHAAFWNGSTHRLTPAYDIAPQRRTSREANQAMILSDGSRAAQLRNAAAIAPAFGIDQPQFKRIADRLVGTIVDHWIEVCDEAGLSRNERAAFAGRQFFNDFAFDGFSATPVLS
jgi:serine/threonine-protein kinase HipA